MTDYDIQADISRLRTEIQADRLATMSMIQLGFNSLHEKIDKHVQDDNEVEQRVGVIEDRLSLFGKFIWGIYIALIGALTTMWFGRHGG